jgi:hypothetical protein
MKIQLLSYPLEELNSMLVEEKFLKELGDQMIIYYFGPEKKIEEKIILEETSEISNQENGPGRISSLYDPSARDLL